MPRPWEIVPARPWEGQQPLYPRTLAVHRPNVNTAAGDRGYSGVTRGNEQVVASNLPAKIELRSRGGEPDASIPADAYGRAAFVIFVPASAGIAEGTIAENDIGIDDLGKRYQIAAVEWTPLATQMFADLLKP